MSNPVIGLKGVVPNPIYVEELDGHLSQFMANDDATMVILTSDARVPGGGLILGAYKGSPTNAVKIPLSQDHASSLASLFRVYAKHGTMCPKDPQSRSPKERYVAALDVMTRLARMYGLTPGDAVAALLDYAIQGMHANGMHGKERQIFAQAQDLHDCRLDHVSTFFDTDAVQKAKG